MLTIFVLLDKEISIDEDKSVLLCGRKGCSVPSEKNDASRSIMEELTRRKWRFVGHVLQKDKAEMF